VCGFTADKALQLLPPTCYVSIQDVFLTLLCTPIRYLGFSWASGVVTLSGKPYPNGRNQESASEAIAAYEAVALYGDVMVSAEKYVTFAAHRCSTWRRVIDIVYSFLIHITHTFVGENLRRQRQRGRPEAVR
jgi:hypothetical protein